MPNVGDKFTLGENKIVELIELWKEWKGSDYGVDDCEWWLCVDQDGHLEIYMINHGKYPYYSAHNYMYQCVP